ncbi:MAG: membrane protein insertion efficiency factor YidD [Gammaproteobacteria bacterium]|nr:membrane protein insertion efficiency factor YidD [Gammaproteobacteria bacterium]
MKHFFIFLIRFYQVFISPMLGKRCRFHPTCSEYAKQAFETLPVHKACCKTICRLSKCHPFNKSNPVDPL